MKLLLIHNANVVLQDFTHHGAVLIRDGRIAQFFFPSQLPTGLRENETLDANGAYLAPGMIDIHIHGSAGVDVQNATQDELAKLSEFLLNEGVTGYLATFVLTGEKRDEQA